MISVLLVDDDPALLEITRIYLEKNKKMMIDTAQSAAEAQGKLKSSSYEVIVSDYDMPGMTGIEFLTALRSSGDLTPFIIFTGKGQEQVAMEAINNGADFYLIRAGDPKNEIIYLTHKINKAVEQRRAEIAVRESEEHLRKLLHSLPSGVLVIDADTHTIIQANPSALHIMGEKAQDLIGKSCFGLICPVEDGQCPVTDLGHRPDSIEQVMVRKDGSHIPVIKSVARSIIGNRKVLVESFIDLSGQKKAELDLHVSNEKYRHLIEQSNEAIVVAQDEMLRLVNQRMVEITGYSEQELLGLQFSMVIEPEDRPMVMERHQKRMKGEDAPSRYSFRLRQKDGSTRWVDISVTAIDWDGRPATLNLLTDITEQKHAEHRQYLAAEIMGILNDPSTLEDSINLILAAIKRETGFDAVGIRLRNGDDYPYTAQNGFNCDFLRTENLLVSRDTDGSPRRDNKGNLLVECTCGLVLSEKTDPANPLFTKGGSCWTNNSKVLLDLEPEQDPRFHPRNTCIHQGFLSIALIPIRTNREVIGLLQLNDRTKDCFTLEMVHFFEGIGASIGVALMRKWAEEALKESEEKFRGIFDSVNDGIQIHEINQDWTPGKFIEVNEVACRMLQYTHDELLRHSPLDFVTGFHNRPLVEITRELSSTGHSTFETEHIRKDGTVVPVEINSHVSHLKGKHVMVAVVRDITDRKRAYDEMKRIKVAVDGTSDAIWISTTEEPHFYQNAAFERLFGYTLEEVFLMHPGKLYANEEDAHQVFSTIKAGKSWHGEVEMIAKNGRHIPVSLRADAVKDEEGKIIGFIGVHQDISERKLAEKTLHESREKYRTLVEEIHDMIWLIDAKGQFTYVSPRSIMMLGYHPEEIIGHRLSEFISFEDANNINGMLKKNLPEHKEMQMIETHTRRKDGKIAILESTIIPYYSPGGTITGYRGVSRDITEIKKAEEVKSLLAAIVTSSDDAVVGEDLHHIITIWNQGAERIYGYSAEEMIGTDSYRIVPDVEKGALSDIMDRVLKGERVEHFNTFRIKKDGGRVEISMSLSPILDDKGHILGIAKISRDLTKQRETEKALLAYISETAMRLKIPVELIGGRLSDIQKQVLSGDMTPDEIHLQLQTQIKNTEQIVSNLRDLNIAISTGFLEIPDAYQKYLKQ